MTIIQIHLPDDLAGQVRNLTANAEAFIIDLLRKKVNEMDKDLPLAEQYRMASEENVALMKDFSHVDTEGWDDEY